MTPGSGVTDPRVLWRTLMAALLTLILFIMHQAGWDLYAAPVSGVWAAGAGVAESLYDSRRAAGSGP